MAAAKPISPKEPKMSEMTRSMDELSLSPRYTVEELLQTPHFDVSPVSEVETLDLIGVFEGSFFAIPVGWKKERQNFSDKLNVALTVLDRYFNGWSRTRVEVTPQNNSVYAAYKGQDLTDWYRVRVLSTDTSRCTARVASVDYGWKDWIPFGNFRLLPLDFIVPKPMCVEFTYPEDGKRPYLNRGDRFSARFHTLDDGKWVVSNVRKTADSKLTNPSGNAPNPVRPRSFSKERHHPQKDDRGSVSPHFEGDRSLVHPSNTPRQPNVPQDHPPKGKNLFVRKNNESRSAGHPTGPDQKFSGMNHTKDDRPHPALHSSEPARRFTGQSQVKDDRPRPTTHNSGPTQIKDGRSRSTVHSSGSGQNFGRSDRGQRPKNDDRPYSDDSHSSRKANLDEGSNAVPHVQGTKQVRFSRLPFNEVCTVIIVYTGSEGTFAITEDDALKFQKLEDTLFGLVKAGLPRLLHPKEGDLCLAPFENEMFRSKVLRIHHERRSCTVLYVDYGNQSEVEIDDILECPVDIPLDVHTFRILYAGPPENPVQGARLRVIPKLQKREGVYEVEILSP